MLWGFFVFNFFKSFVQHVFLEDVIHVLHIYQTLGIKQYIDMAPVFPVFIVLCRKPGFKSWFTIYCYLGKYLLPNL